jgi:hypothetical protein
MNSKKLGMFAAAALTVLASQASAGEANKDAKATANVEGVCANTCGSVSGSGCGGKVVVEAGSKDPAACKKANGKWMSKAEFAKSSAPKDAAAPADAHKHPH